MSRNTGSYLHNRHQFDKISSNLAFVLLPAFLDIGVMVQF